MLKEQKEFPIHYPPKETLSHATFRWTLAFTSLLNWIKSSLRAEVMCYTFPSHFSKFQSCSPGTQAWFSHIQLPVPLPASTYPSLCGITLWASGNPGSLLPFLGVSFFFNWNIVDLLIQYCTNFAIDGTDKGLISKIYKQFIQLNNNHKKQKTQSKTGQKKSTDIQMVYRWPVCMWKDAQQH